MRESFPHRVLLATGIAALVVLLLLFTWQALTVLLLVFAGVVLSVFLHWLAELFHGWLGVPHGLSLAMVFVAILVVGGLIGIVIVPLIVDQALLLQEQIPRSVAAIKDAIGRTPWGAELLDTATRPEEWLLKRFAETGEVMAQVAGIFSSALNALLAGLFILLIGVYLAAEPHTYTNGLLRLLPRPRRARAQEVMAELARTLRWWLAGQTLSMLILGTLTTLSLWLLDVPLALVLGLLTALMTFIPNLGPIIAGIPTLLVALTQGPMTALYVAILYVAIQAIEGNLITPVVHRNVVHLPPVLILSVQGILATMIGFLGVLLAMPLVACGMVLVRMLYVEDVLGDSMDRPT